MSNATTNRTAVSIGRLLTGVFIVSYLLEAGGVIEVSYYLRLDFLFVVALTAGLIGVVTLYWRSLSRAFVGLRSTVTNDVDHLVVVTTRNVVFLFVGLLLLSRTRIAIHHHVDLSILFALTVGLLALALLVRTDENTTLAITYGSALAVGIVLGSTILAAFGSPIGGGALESSVTRATSMLALTLVGVVLWKRERRATSVQQRAHRTVFGVSPYSILLCAVTLLGAILFTYRLGEFHLQGDEYLVADTAASYYYTGELYRWDWIGDDHASRYYDRAWPHTLLVAASYAVFGISEWSARIVSVAFGVLTIPLTYVVVKYFTEHKTVAIVTSLALAVSPNVVFYFRWARMYALLIPLVLALTYLVYRTLTESNTLDLRNDRLNATVERYFDVNLTLGVVTIPLVYLAYQIHYNALIVLAAAFVFVVFRALTTREQKFKTATLVGLAGIAVVVLLARYTAHVDFLEQFLSFFDRENTIYREYLFRYPLEWTFGFGFFVVGLLIPLRLEDDELKHKLLFLYILCAFSLVFYVYVGDRYASYAYIVHIVPFAIALVVFAYVTFVDALEVPILKYALLFLLVVSLVIPMYPGAEGRDYQSLYDDDSQDFTTAYGTITDDFDSDEDVLFAQYARDYYLRDLPEDTIWISMQNNQQYAPSEFYADLDSHGSGWITWESGKSYHIHGEIRAYIDEHFEQHHGSGVDDTGVEVYYFDESMIE